MGYPGCQAAGRDPLFPLEPPLGSLWLEHFIRIQVTHTQSGGVCQANTPVDSVMGKQSSSTRPPSTASASPAQPLSLLVPVPSSSAPPFCGRINSILPVGKQIHSYWWTFALFPVWAGKKAAVGSRVQVFAFFKTTLFLSPH